MPNPNGGFLQANAGYTWANGDVYEIVQTDTNEGAATGASFGGLGIENQPHQLLLNKINYLHGHQVTDEENIGLLQVFKGLFTSTLTPNGWLKLGVQDLSLGQVQAMLQWGFVNVNASLSGSPAGDTRWTVLWNVPFQHTCLWAGATIVYFNIPGAPPSTNTPDIGVGLDAANPSGLPDITATQGTFFLNLFSVNGPLSGFTWYAIGY